MRRTLSGDGDGIVPCVQVTTFGATESHGVPYIVEELSSRILFDLLTDSARTSRGIHKRASPFSFRPVFDLLAEGFLSWGRVGASA